MSPAPPQSNLASLDLARGTMAAIVFLSHAAIFSGSVGDLRYLFRFGGVAVEIFMFISGFLMLWHYQIRAAKEPWEKPGTWRKFWLRRFFRMAPLYWVVLSIVFLFHAPIHNWLHHVHALFPLPWAGREIAPERIDWQPGWGNALAHYSFVFGLIPRWASNNVLPDWSITLEMQFYLLFPFMALLMKKAGWAIAMVVMIAIWKLFAARIGVGIIAEAGEWGWYPMPTILPLRLGVFYAGMLAAAGLAAWFGERRGLVRMVAAIGLAFWCDRLLAAFALVFLIWELSGPHLRRSWPSIRKRLDSFLECKPIRIFADCSYGVYLCHSLILLGVLWLLLQWEGFSVLSPVNRFLLLTLASTPLVFGISFACHRWIETPGIKVGKFLAARSRNPETPPTTTTNNPV